MIGNFTAIITLRYVICGYTSLQKNLKYLHKHTLLAVYTHILVHTHTCTYTQLHKILEILVTVI